MSTTLATLLPDVLGRVEENVESGPIFWSLAGEVYPQMVDAEFEAALVTGTVQQGSVLVTLAANTTWFSFFGSSAVVPRSLGALAAIRMRAPYPIRKTSLKSLDDMQPNWETAQPSQQLIAWGPLGLSGFFVYPQLAVEASVTMDFIVSPVNQYRPYTGATAVPFQVEFTDAFSQGAAAALRMKEGSSEAEEASVVYEAFLSRLKALSLFQSRVDALVFSGAYGGRQPVNGRTQV